MKLPPDIDALWRGVSLASLTPGPCLVEAVQLLADGYAELDHPAGLWLGRALALALADPAPNVEYESRTRSFADGKPQVRLVVRFPFATISTGVAFLPAPDVPQWIHRRERPPPGCGLFAETFAGSGTGYVSFTRPAGG